MPKKLSEEEKVERKAKAEMEKTLKEIAKAEAAEAKRKEKEEKEKQKEKQKEQEKEKKAAKKFGHRVHVVPDKILHCRGTFIEPVLGGWPGDKQIYSTYVASKAPDAKTMKEEIEAFGSEDVEAQHTTILPKDKNGRICLKGYHFRGFFNSAAESLKRAEMLEIVAHKKTITQLVKVSASPDTIRLDPWIPMEKPQGTSVYLEQRPLRGNTPQGEIVALASSEALPAGTTFEFYIWLLNEKLEQAVLSWLEYGKVNGLLQNRNAGYGRFATEVEVDGKWIPIEQVESV